MWSIAAGDPHAPVGRRAGRHAGVAGVDGDTLVEVLRPVAGRGGPAGTGRSGGVRPLGPPAWCRPLTWSRCRRRCRPARPGRSAAVGGPGRSRPPGPTRWWRPDTLVERPPGGGADDPVASPARPPSAGRPRRGGCRRQRAVLRAGPVAEGRQPSLQVEHPGPRRRPAQGAGRRRRCGRRRGGRGRGWRSWAGRWVGGRVVAALGGVAVVSVVVAVVSGALVEDEGAPVAGPTVWSGWSSPPQAPVAAASATTAARHADRAMRAARAPGLPGRPWGPWCAGARTVIGPPFHRRGGGAQRPRHPERHTAPPASMYPRASCNAAPRRFASPAFAAATSGTGRPAPDGPTAGRGPGAR